jgi:O-antigen/teichoic acid export membrane protein
LIISIKEKFIYFFTKGHERTLKAKKHATLSLVYRGVDLAIGLALVPLVLNYLDETRYGIWLVLFSLTGYFRFMNIGLEQGLRNKLAESKARGETEKARHYVSTTYATIGVISISFFLIFLTANQFLDWTKILNTNPDLQNDLSTLALFVFGCFSLTFILKIVTTIAVADQKPSVLNLKELLEKIFKLIFILIVIAYVPSSLLVMGIGYSIMPILVLTGYSLYFFNKKYKILRPSIKYVDFHYIKDLAKLGIKFFVISIAVIILFATDNLIITQLFGPEHVTPYQIAHRYFGVPLMLFVLIVQPLWSAVTEAYTKKDFNWIKNTVNKLNNVWILFTIGVLIMLFASPYIFKIWIGDAVHIPLMLSVFWALFSILFMLNSIYTNVINGTGKIKLQTLIASSSIIINIPLSVFLAKNVGMGSSGVIFATTISIMIYIFFKLAQYKKIVNQKATGIWNE